MTESTAGQLVSGDTQISNKLIEDVWQANQDKIKTQAERYFAEQNLKAANISKESAQIQASAHDDGGGGGK